MSSDGPKRSLRRSAGAETRSIGAVAPAVARCRIAEPSPGSAKIARHLAAHLPCGDVRGTTLPSECPRPRSRRAPTDRGRGGCRRPPARPSATRREGDRQTHRASLAPPRPRLRRPARRDLDDELGASACGGDEEQRDLGVGILRHADDHRPEAGFVHEVPEQRVGGRTRPCARASRPPDVKGDHARLPTTTRPAETRRMSRTGARERSTPTPSATGAGRLTPGGAASAYSTKTRIGWGASSTRYAGASAEGKAR